MEIIEVTTRQAAKEFLHLPLKIYRDNPAWIRPLDKDIEGTFDPNVNKTFRHGQATRWIVKKVGETIGRIGAFINDKTKDKDNKQPTGGVGFFECVDDQAAANLLFDTAKAWLQERGMQAMDGPINFGDRNAWWGLLIDGFHLEPNYQCNFNPPYYVQLFENYGFQLYFKQLTFSRLTKEPVDPRLMEKALMIMGNKDYEFRHIKKRHWRKHAEEFRTVYNAAWARHSGVPEMTRQMALTVMKKMKPIMDEKIIWFGYFKGEPIAFYVNLPEVNQVFKHLNGQFNLWAKLKFLWHQWRKTNQKMLGIVFGIAPEHQGKGVDGALIEATRVMVQEKYKRYPLLELNWIGDFNPRMIRVAEQVGGEVSKTHVTYRYLFDRSIPFERMPIKG
jgi:hypothetical protein